MFCFAWGILFEKCLIKKIHYKLYLTRLNKTEWEIVPSCQDLILFFLCLSSLNRSLFSPVASSSENTSWRVRKRSDILQHPFRQSVSQVCSSKLGRPQNSETQTEMPTSNFFFFCFSPFCSYLKDDEPWGEGEKSGGGEQSSASLLASYRQWETRSSLAQASRVSQSSAGRKLSECLWTNFVISEEAPHSFACMLVSCLLRHGKKKKKGGNGGEKKKKFLRCSIW